MWKKILYIGYYKKITANKSIDCCISLHKIKLE